MADLYPTHGHAARLAVLPKILGLLGSNADGECLNAARRAHRMVQEAGLTWPDVIRIGLPQHRHSTMSGAYAGAQQAENHQFRARWALTQPGITEWERDFLSTLAHQTQPPSPKQAPILKRIIAKLEARS